MQTGIPYSLRVDGDHAQAYYDEVRQFTDEVLMYAQTHLQNTIVTYLEYRKMMDQNEELTIEECTLELLTLGVLWRLYGSDAHDLPAISQQLLKTLVDLRQQGAELKAGIDYVRGILATQYLTPDNDYTAKWVLPTLEHFDCLLGYLIATGDFEGETLRLQQWRNYLAGQPQTMLAECLVTAFAFAEWFTDRSREVLGDYTRGVEVFLKEQQLRHRWREDIVSSGKQQVEYHLNMVGAEILGRVYQAGFIQTERKLVLLPSCLRKRRASECLATSAHGGYLCSSCESDCRINELSRLGRKHGFAVLFATHESQVFDSNQSPERSIGSNVGVVGVACVTRLLSSGWKAKARGIPVQCVLLDYCGCGHWHDPNISTDLSEEYLLAVLGVNQEKG